MSRILIPTNSPQHWAIRALWAAATIAAVLYVPVFSATGTISDMTFALELAIAAMSLNLLIGYGGVISLGHSAFFGIGGYTTGILFARYGWSQGWTIPVGAAIAFVVGAFVCLPALRLRGIYVALVTLALAVLFPAFIKWEKAEWLTEGARGISGIAYKDVPSLPFVGDDSPREARAIFMYWMAVLLAVIAYLVCRGVVKSRVGRSLIAIRDNETAAVVMGVNAARTKIVTFGLSAAMCATAGSLFSIRNNLVNAVDIPYFSFLGAIIFLVVMVVGGPATLWGPIVGAVLYVLLDTTARDWGADADSEDAGLITSAMQDLFGWMTGSPAALISAIVLLVMMFVAPFGLVGLFKRIAARFVVIVPKPAGSGPAAAPPPALSLHAAEASIPIDEVPDDELPVGGHHGSAPPAASDLE